MGGAGSAWDAASEACKTSKVFGGARLQGPTRVKKNREAIFSAWDAASEKAKVLPFGCGSG